MVEENVIRVKRILEKLAQVRERGLSCFGSEAHHFRLNAPLSNDEIVRFETEHDIRLPDDYRAFLEHAGNGGAGPFYGIYPLKKWDDFASWVLEDVPERFLVLPCPLHPDLEPTADWMEKLDGVSPYQGTLALGTQGCTYASLLIVSGPYAGRVVYVEAGDQPPYMMYENDFLSWYERWLDELLKGYKTHWFGFGLGGDEEDFIHILQDSETSDELKSEAAHALNRLPNLSDSTAKLIPSLLESPIEGVRHAALAAMGVFHLEDTANQLAIFLNDPSPDIQRQAINTAMEVNPSRYTDVVLHKLWETNDKEIATTAYFQLKKAEVLKKPELLRIIRESASESLRGLAAYDVKWAEEDIPLLNQMLLDSYSQVRSYATLGLRQVKARNSLPQILDALSREKDVHVIGSILKTLGEFGDRNAVPALLEWSESEDDFHRLDAIEALVKIGDERALPQIVAMLGEHRRPERLDPHGFGGMSNSNTISSLVRKSLKESPNPAFRGLA